MKKFLFRVFLFFLPFFFVLVGYIICDPFKVIYNHGEQLYVENGTIDGFSMNRDFVGTEILLDKQSSNKYDSFIFGSSRASVYNSQEWLKYLQPESSPFLFIGSGESLYGIWTKMKLLEKLNIPIRNALLVIDYELLQNVTDGAGVIAIRHPKATGRYLGFHFTFLKEFISTDFFLQYFDYKFFNTRRNYMDKLFDNIDRGIQYNSSTNDWWHKGSKDSILNDSIGYYQKMSEVFYKRSESELESPQVINDDSKLMLDEVLSYLKDNDTNYRIIISPLYDQRKMSEIDLNHLIDTFGEEYVFDFSGINEVTAYVGNYYESSHYKPFIAQELLDKVYAN